MKIIDLTHLLDDNTPVYPGTAKPNFYHQFTVKENGFAETKISMYSHNGTHIDAPAHMKLEAPTLDRMPLERFAGRGIVIDCTQTSKQEMGLEYMHRYRERIEKVEFVLLKTGWSKFWGQPDYFEKYPYLTEEAAEWLTSLGLKGVGIDTISIDDINTDNFPVHHKLFDKSIVIIENLTNLDELGEGVFHFLCLPLKYKEADGSPVRAVAIFDSEQI